ncbi:hypothetical protein Tco_1560505 [Tanacetum coccineum]
MEECFKALTDKLDWNNPEGDRCPFDLTKPVPLKGCPSRLTVAAEYFFNSGISKIIRPRKEHKVYSTLKILSVVSVKVKKLHGYGLFEEIVVGRVDRQLYKFKEGDFIDLHLNDIEDMLLLAVQHKLFQLDGSDIVDFIVALRILEQMKVIRADELYKFSDRTLKLVHDELHHRALNFCLGYNKEMSRRKWSAIDRRRSELMVKLIDK